ncbi:MAG: hypothetical protein M1834_002345 [Cirrosporium novae-zelandiae]|nr:MAG: hypothetical protein M1834_002345 [Cirrosporium novae-zelandiae]
MATVTDNLPVPAKLAPYWEVNVPKGESVEECPEYLRNLSDRDIAILSKEDKDYRHNDWAETKLMIYTKRYDMFHRVPSDLRRYLKFKYDVMKKYGSVENYMIKERLHWENDLKPKGKVAFAEPSDYKIIINDWPYGLAEKIVHLTVWTKFKLTINPDTLIPDDLSPQVKRVIDRFVAKTFPSTAPKKDTPILRDVAKMPKSWGCGRNLAQPTNNEPISKRGDVAWFRNWGEIQSVKGPDHFHVLLNDPDLEFVKKITNNDVPLYAKKE